MGFKFVSLQIKIGDYERPILRTLFYGAQNRRSEPSRFWFSFLASISLRIGIVLYARLLCQIIIWNKERVACSWKCYRLVEKGDLTLVIISRSSRWHTTNIICWSAAAATACCISKGHVAQGPRLVSGHGPLWGQLFLWSLTSHELGYSQLKG